MVASIGSIGMRLDSSGLALQRQLLTVLHVRHVLHLLLTMEAVLLLSKMMMRSELVLLSFSFWYLMPKGEKIRG